MSFLESQGWKKFMAKTYGIGSAIVIVGALFKIMHFPYSGLLLTVGMSVEAVIFLISAFEPLPKEYHWENVFPEVAGHGHSHESSLASVAAGRPSPAPAAPAHVAVPAPTSVAPPAYSAPSYNAPSFNLEIDQTTTDDLKHGIKRFTDSIGHMSNLSVVLDASEELAGNMHKVSASMVSISDSTHMLSDSYQKNVQIIQQFNDQSKMGLEQMRSGYEFYRGQLETLGRTMGSVNSTYELYLQEAKKVQTDYNALHAEMAKLIGGVQSTVGETQNFGSQMSNLNKNVQNLNSIYGNMLTAVNSVLNK